MSTQPHSPLPCRPRSLWSRRAVLQAGALGVAGLSLTDVLHGRAAAGTESAQTAVILLYLHGGPSHLETYDLKPAAPSTYRSAFAPIATNVAGMSICEHLPLHAARADRFSLIRSLHHDVGIHSDGGIVVLTGKRPEPLDPTSTSKSAHPDFGSLASRVRGLGQNPIPPYIAVPNRLYMTRPTYLGLHHAAFEAGDPNVAGYKGPEIRVAGLRDAQVLGDRRKLLEALDRFRPDLDQTGQLQGTASFRELAFDLLTSPVAARAFQIDEEAPVLRERYGRHHWGQACLLARRLAEAGCAVVSVYIDAPASGSEHTNWDDHIGNAGRPGHFADYLRRRLPYYDQALSALIDDIHNRQLEQRILVVAMGEFGRTPRLVSNATGTGRDHWPDAYTALVSGGGLKMGQVIGATNSKGEFPTDRPLTPQDLLATIYRHLKIDPQTAFPDFQGRPIPILPSGQPIAELL